MNEDKLGRLNDGGYNNLIGVVLILVVIYMFVSGFTKSKQQTYLDNAGTDLNTQQAQALRDAMNRSGIAIMMSVDGTDVALIMSTAQQITDYKKVADAYRVLYNSELTTDLSTELNRVDLQQFYDIINKKSATVGTTTPATSTPTNVSQIGKNVTATQTVNIRLYEDPKYTDHQAAKGDVLGKYAGETYLTVTGTKELFVHIKVDAFWGLYTVDYYVHKGSVKIG